MDLNSAERPSYYRSELVPPAPINLFVSARRFSDAEIPGLSLIASKYAPLALCSFSVRDDNVGCGCGTKGSSFAVDARSEGAEPIRNQYAAAPAKAMNRTSLTGMVAEVLDEGRARYVPVCTRIVLHRRHSASELVFTKRQFEHFTRSIACFLTRGNFLQGLRTSYMARTSSCQQVLTNRP